MLGAPACLNAIATRLHQAAGRLQQEPSLWKECEACLWAVRSIAVHIPKEEDEAGGAMRHIMQAREKAATRQGRREGYTRACMQSHPSHHSLTDTSSSICVVSCPHNTTQQQMVLALPPAAALPPTLQETINHVVGNNARWLRGHAELLTVR